MLYIYMLGYPPKGRRNADTLSISGSRGQAMDEKVKKCFIWYKQTIQRSSSLCPPASACKGTNICSRAASFSYCE